MSSPQTRPLLPTPLLRVLGWTLVYLLLIVGVFSFPNTPGTGLDPSWRMALGYFYEQGMQFGKDVVFTYGPLGFVMGRTFSGLQFWSLIAGQLVLAVVSATVILGQTLRLEGAKRLVFLLFIFLFAMLYEDALHMIVLAILGFELLRIVEKRSWLKIATIAAILAGYAQIKFTDCLLAGFIVLIVTVFGLWRRRVSEVITLLVAFLVVYLGIWIACGQGVVNLPAYFRGSWEISQGYQWAMGFPAPTAALWKGIVVFTILGSYAIAHLFLNPDKPRAWANSVLLGAFVYLNWKHGFVRADGHMIGFFFCALLPLITYPALLDDPDSHRFLHRWVFALTIFLSVWALESALDGTIRLSMGWMENRIWGNCSQVINWKETRQMYRERLSVQRAGADLSETRKIIGRSSIDVLGTEQSVAIYNQFNYRPRPVIQSYSTFTPELARLNEDFIVSDRAPEFFLTRIETIDNRLLTMDDAQVLQLLPYRYEYLRTEKDFQLWKRLPGPFDAAKFAPKLLRTATVELNQPLDTADLVGKPLWATIKVETSWLGKLRSFFYKPPQVVLGITDTSGVKRDYLMPLPQGRNGFILNPVINDTVDYMHYASAKPLRWASSITLKVAPEDTKFFAPMVQVELSALPPLPTTGEKYFPKDLDKLFFMFRTMPIAYEAHLPYSPGKIDGRDVAIMHAPSLMTFDLQEGAKYVSGSFGMMVGSYTAGGRTNGARFIVYWANGSDRKDLFQQYLNPLSVKADRGMHDFKVDLTGVSGGRLFLEVNPGPYNDIGWDWTGWTDIYIAR
ncbi:MAG: hypothetical protein ABI273_12230 [Lacunisphaera sp.]